MILNSMEQNLFYGEMDKREIPRIKLSSLVPMDSSRWDLELSMPVTSVELEKLLAKYQGDCLEDNLFFENTFLSAAFGRMNKSETSLLTVWETTDSERRLKMYFPIVAEKVGITGTKLWHCWSHDYAPLGVPIVNSEDANEVLARFIQLLGKIENPAFPALMLKDIPIAGKFASELRLELKNSGASYAEFKTNERAVLVRDDNFPSTPLVDISAKKRRQLDRQLRRIGELGEMKLECVDAYTDIILRFEEFLSLESDSWKGRKGTSMHTIKQTAAFARQAVTGLAQNKQCSIYSIRLDGQSIAFLIVLNSNGIFYPWKITFDKNYGQFSPGAVLMYKVSQMLENKSDFTFADSLAGTSNQLVNLLWKKRMDLGSFLLPVGNTPTSQILSYKDKIERQLKIKKFAKRMIGKK